MIAWIRSKIINCKVPGTNSGVGNEHVLGPNFVTKIQIKLGLS